MQLATPLHSSNGMAVRDMHRAERIFRSRTPKRALDVIGAAEENDLRTQTPELVRRQSKLAKMEAAELSLAASIAFVPQRAREAEAPCTLSDGQRRARAAALQGKTGMGVNLSAVTSLSLLLDCSFTKASCEEAAPRLAQLLRRAAKLTSLDCRGDFASVDNALDVLEPLLQAASPDLEELALPACLSTVTSAASLRLASALERFVNVKKIHVGQGCGAIDWMATVVPPGCSILVECP
jgi:hypothetical protein